jgi:hypothetical protein
VFGVPSAAVESATAAAPDCAEAVPEVVTDPNDRMEERMPEKPTEWSPPVPLAEVERRVGGDRGQAVSGAATG